MENKSYKNNNPCGQWLTNSPRVIYDDDNTSSLTISSLNHAHFVWYLMVSSIAPTLSPLPQIFTSYRRRHHHHHQFSFKTHLTRRSILLSTTTLPISSIPSTQSSPSPRSPPPDTTITDRIFMDFSLCSTNFRPDRTLSDTTNLSSLCFDSIPLGRIILGLYGHLVPLTVSNFKSMCSTNNKDSKTSTYKGTVIHKLFPGQFFMAGRQGDKPGEVRRPSGLPRNTETIESKAFSLTHSRSGLISLCLSENDDDDEIKLDPDYRNVEFLITTGPGPCPDLDYKNIVFGTVLEGLDVVRAIAAIPTYRPDEKIRQFNDFAEFLGDERAQNARANWNKPLKTVYISDCGELKVAKPSLSPPSLP